MTHYDNQLVILYIDYKISLFVIASKGDDVEIDFNNKKATSFLSRSLILMISQREPLLRKQLIEAH